MIRVMLDTDQLDALTGVVPLLATYADLVPNLSAEQSKFPNSELILIDRGMGDPSGQASIIDVETGAHKPADIPAWFDKQSAAGVRDLTVYCSRDTLPAVDSALGGRNAFRWVATLDGTCHITGFTALRSPAAVQILGSAAVGIHADLSLVLEDQWHPAAGQVRTAALKMYADQAHTSIMHALSDVTSIITELA